MFILLWLSVFLPIIGGVIVTAKTGDPAAIIVAVFLVSVIAMKPQKINKQQTGRER